MISDIAMSGPRQKDESSIDHDNTDVVKKHQEMAATPAYLNNIHRITSNM